VSDHSGEKTIGKLWFRPRLFVKVLGKQDSITRLNRLPPDVLPAFWFAQMLSESQKRTWLQRDYSPQLVPCHSLGPPRGFGKTPKKRPKTAPPRPTKPHEMKSVQV